MSALDTIARKQADAALSRYGKSVTLKTSIPGAHDPVTHKATLTEVSYTVKGLVESFNSFQVNGTSILRDDVRLTLAALNLAAKPAPDWSVDISVDGVTRTYSIITVDPIYSGELAAMYVCQLRK